MALLAYNPYAFTGAVLFIWGLAVILYLGLRPRHVPGAHWLQAFFACFMFCGATMFLGGLRQGWREPLVLVQNAFLVFAGVTLVGFAYRFPAHDEPGAAVWPLVGVLALALLTLEYSLIQARGNENPRAFVDLWFSYLLPAVYALVILLFLLRAIHYTALDTSLGEETLPIWHAIWHPPNRSARALRNYALALFPGAASMAASLRAVPAPFSPYVLAAGALLTPAAMLIVFLTYASAESYAGLTRSLRASQEHQEQQVVALRGRVAQLTEENARLQEENRRLKSAAARLVTEVQAARARRSPTVSEE